MDDSVDGRIDDVGEDSDVVLVDDDVDVAVAELVVNEASLDERGLNGCRPLGRSHDREATRRDTNRPQVEEEEEEEEDMNGALIDALNIENQPVASLMYE